MKKAKIMFASIAVLAVVGGSLAFKAHSYFNNVIYTTAVFNADATVTVHATTAASGTNEVYYTAVHGDPATAYAFTEVDQ
jgi:hypothetical protein